MEFGKIIIFKNPSTSHSEIVDHHVLEFSEQNCVWPEAVPAPPPTSALTLIFTASDPCPWRLLLLPHLSPSFSETLPSVTLLRVRLGLGVGFLEDPQTHPRCCLATCNAETPRQGWAGALHPQSRSREPLGCLTQRVCVHRHPIGGWKSAVVEVLALQKPGNATTHHPPPPGAPGGERFLEHHHLPCGGSSDSDEFWSTHEVSLLQGGGNTQQLHPPS